ncbi:MAG: glycosyltransferase [Proteobacteria bacterium]|nr:glycosyltransferase [Pseudomonadota bacterium]
MKQSEVLTEFQAAKSMSYVGFMNSYSDGISGGDFAFIDFFKRLNPVELTIVTSEMGRKLCQKNGLSAQFVLTTKETHFLNPVATYLKRIVFGVLASIRLKCPQVIYVSSDILPDVIPAVVIKVIAKIMGKKVLFFQKSFHVNSNGRKISSRAQKISFYLIRKFSDHVTTCSPLSQREIALAASISLDKISVTLLGVDLAALSAIEPSAMKYSAVYLARLHESKGVLDLPKMWRLVVDRIPDARLAVIGKGSLEIVQTLRQEIDGLGLHESIDILGYLEGTKGQELIRASQIFVSPSHEEGFGLAIAEAMALRVPVVAFSLPVYKEVFSDAILSARCFDIVEFSKNCLDLLSNDNLREHYAQKGWEVAKRLSLEEATSTEVFAIMKGIQRIS